MVKKNAARHGCQAGTSDTWLWQCGLSLPDGEPIQRPICPVCSYVHNSERKKSAPARCPVCGTKLKKQVR